MLRLKLMPMIVTPQIALEVACHEGVVRQAYKDSVGVWTWSVGITSASGHNVERYIDKPQPMSKCLDVWLWLMERYAAQVRSAFKNYNLTDEQFAAALSFHWNTGGIKKASWVKHFKAGDMRAAERAFMAWRKPPEIIPRRKAEADLLFRGKWSGKGFITEYTRVTKRNTPVWSSGVRRNIIGDVNEILGESKPINVELEHALPKEEPTHSEEGWFKRFLRWFIS
jgi:GH24 family phage-related lysozyme (muramidase)